MNLFHFFATILHFHWCFHRHPYQVNEGMANILWQYGHMPFRHMAHKMVVYGKSNTNSE